MSQKPGPENPVVLPLDVVLVSVAELKAILRAVPGWVPMGAPGDGDWSPEALDAKERVMQRAGLTTKDLYS